MTAPLDDLAAALQPFAEDLENRLAARMGVAIDPLVVAVQNLQTNQRAIVDALSSLQLAVTTLISRMDLTNQFEARVTAIEARLAANDQ